MKEYLDFPAALKSFMGYLEGTEKSVHTIKNYRFDLMNFQKFLGVRYEGKTPRLRELDQDDLEGYSEFLKKEGLRTNTRRRRLLTIRRFMGYLSRRNKVPQELDRKLPAPHKIERIPFTIPSEALIGEIRALPAETVLDARNRVLLWVMAETGCLVSEVTRLRFEQWVEKGKSVELRILGKAARAVPVSRELFEAVQELRDSRNELKAPKGPKADDPWLFHGFNRHGSMGKPMSPRGVELLVRAYAGRLFEGAPNAEEDEEVTPRTFRHSAVLRWFQEGKSRDEIQKLLGLKSAYAFRVYDVLFAAQAKK